MMGEQKSEPGRNGVASKLRKTSRAGHLTFSAASLRRLNLFERGVKCGGNGSQPPSHEASAYGLDFGVTSRRAKEDEGRSRKLSLFHFSARSFWSLITTNRLVLIFLIDELAAASPSCGGRCANFNRIGMIFL